MEKSETISQKIFQYLSEYMYIYFNQTFDDNKKFIDEFFNLMKNYDHRLLTYAKTWDKLLTTNELAQAGFIQVLSDNVQCVYCRMVINDFSSEHDPRVLYPYHFPICPYIFERIE